MKKVLCEFDGIQVECKVIENMGYQGGDYVKAVEHGGKERIVVKRGNIWKPKSISEKCGLLALDDKTIPVTFHVSKFIPKIDIE